jgi:hypothetical protein
MSSKLGETETGILDGKMEKLKKGALSVSSIITKKTWKDER